MKPSPVMEWVLLRVGGGEWKWQRNVNMVNVPYVLVRK
jgi:hypothetical protein